VAIDHARRPAARVDRGSGWLVATALAALAVAVVAKALGSAPYLVVIGGLALGAVALAVHAWLVGSRVDPYAGPIAFKLAILAVTIFLQPSLVGRDPHFEVAVTERLLASGTWEPGLGFVSQKATGYAHYPGLSLVTGTLAALTGVEVQALARLVPPALTLTALVIVVTLAREVLADDRLAAWVGLAWAAFSLTNVFQAMYVHESLGFVFFLAGILFLFRYARRHDPVFLAAFVLVAAALVLTHHLSTAFLLTFLILFVLSHHALEGVGLGSGVSSAWLPVSVFAVFAVGYTVVFGDPSVLGQFDSLFDTITSPMGDPAGQPPPDPVANGSSASAGADGSANASTGDTPDPNVQEAVFYERQGRDVFIFNTRAVLTVALVAFGLLNVAWRAVHGTLDGRRVSLLAWSGVLLGIMLAVYVTNVTVGLDAPRMLPWGYVFLLVLAADVPSRESVFASARERLAPIRDKIGDVAALVPSPRPVLAVVGALLVVFATFQLYTLSPHLLGDDREPAHYRSQVRMYYATDEQAMADWVDEELDDGTVVYGDLTTHELVGPMAHGEVHATGSYVYSGDGEPVGETYILWREEMNDLYLGLDKSLSLVFFPVDEDQRRTFATSPAYAKLYDTPNTGAYVYAE